MANFNKLILAGNLTRSVEIKNLPNGTTVGEFGIAVNEKFKEKEYVLFIDCTIFGKGAEIIAQYCQKGSQILLEGRLRLDVWTDKQGGGKRSKHSMIVDTFQFIGGKPQGQSQGPQRPQQQPAENPISDEQEFDPESIPF